MVAIIISVFAVIVGNGLRIVPEYQRLVVFRLGALLGVRGPGIAFLLPFIDSAIKVDVREQAQEISPILVPSNDAQPLSLRLLWHFRVLDPARAVTQVGNFEKAVTDLAVKLARSALSGLSQADLIFQQQSINQTLHAKLDELTQPWGVQVISVELREGSSPSG